MTVVLRILNSINMLAMLMFVFAFNGSFLITVENGTLTETICVNQIIIALVIAAVIGVIATIRKIPRPETGTAIIIKSSKDAKIISALLLIICLAAGIYLKLNLILYMFVCLMHAMGILECGRIIKKF